MEKNDDSSTANTREDRLKTVNRELQDNQKKDHQDDTSWLPLESNPDIFNIFATKIGLKEDYEFIDVISPDLIKNHSKVVALILLFPCTEKILQISCGRGKKNYEAK